MLLVGTVLVVFGTRNPDTGIQANRQSNSLNAMCPPLAVTPGLVTRGAALQRMECAGCHADDRREVGPSYQVIAARYHCRPGQLLLALTHPKPGWSDYPQGPAGPPLAGDDRTALVYWILSVGGKGNE